MHRNRRDRLSNLPVIASAKRVAISAAHFYVYRSAFGKFVLLCREIATGASALAMTVFIDNRLRRFWCGTLSAQSADWAPPPKGEARRPAGAGERIATGASALAIIMC